MKGIVETRQFANYRPQTASTANRRRIRHDRGNNASRPLLRELVEQLEILPRLGLESEVIAHAIIAAHAQGGAAAFVGEQLADALGERRGFAGGDEEAVLAVLDDFGVPPTAVATTGTRAANASSTTFGSPSV